MKYYRIPTRKRKVRRLIEHNHLALRRASIFVASLGTAATTVLAAQTMWQRWYLSALCGALVARMLYTYLIRSNNYVARKLVGLPAVLLVSRTLQRYVNHDDLRERFSFVDRDVDYIEQLALDKPAVVEFGSMRPLADTDFPFHLLHHNLVPTSRLERPIEYSVVFGARRTGVRPYELTHLINTSAMSMGALNYKLIEAISAGQCNLGLVNTGEGGLGPHAAGGADLVLQLGTAKYGFCREVHEGGRRFRALDLEKLVRTVEAHPEIKLIELKLSQGAKPGVVHLQGAKVSRLVADVRGIQVGTPAYSPFEHCELRGDSLPEKIDKLGRWMAELRQATKLPVGIKLSIGDQKEISELIKRLSSSGKLPDFITLDGADGGTAGGLAYLTHHVGYGSVVEALVLVDRLLRRYRARDKVILCAAGKLHTPAAAAVAFSAGAQVIFVARGFIYAAAAGNDIRRHLKVSPYALTFSDPVTLSAIDIAKTADSVRQYSVGFDRDLRQLTRVLGKTSPLEIDANSIRRVEL